MNWITNFVRPKIGAMLGQKETSENLWIKCPQSGEMVFHKDLESNLWVVPGSGYHMRISAKERLNSFFDQGQYTLLAVPEVVQDPLKFKDERRYIDRLKEYRTRTGNIDSVQAAHGTIEDMEIVTVIHDFGFMGGSLGMAAGEAILTGCEEAVKRHCPLVLFAASGGARMQEGVLSLMQLPRTTVGVDMLKEAGLPFIVVLTNPTTGGVSASYAMLGDIHIAEPGAMIGFAGKRVIEQTIREKLPADFQTAEYLQDHGMIDMVVKRHDLKPTIANLLRMMMNVDEPVLAIEAPTVPAPAKTASPAPEASTPSA